MTSSPDEEHVQVQVFVLVGQAPVRPGRVARRAVGALAARRRAGSAGEGGRRGRRLGTAGQLSWRSAALAAVPAIPAAVLIVGLLVWPVARTLFASVASDGFAGLDNFRTGLSGEGTGPAVRRTVLWGVTAPTVVTALGLALAVGLRARWPAGEGGRPRLVATALLLPLAVPAWATGVMFRLLHDPDPDRGLMAAATAFLLRVVRADPEAVDSWLSPGLIRFSLLLTFVWMWAGLATYAFTIALDEMPAGLLDRIRRRRGTGAGVLLEVSRWPGVRRVMVVVFALVALATARAFDLILLMVPGAAMDETSVLGVTLWQTGGDTTTGPAAALGVLWLAGIAVLVLGSWWLARRWAEKTRSVTLAQRTPVADPGAAPAVPGVPRAGRPHRWLALGVLGVWLLPVIVLVTTSLNAPDQSATRGLLPTSVSLSSYGQVLSAEADWRTSLFDTAGLALCVTVLVVGLAFLAAFGLGLWATRPDGPSSPRDRSGTAVLLAAAAVVPIQVIAGPVTDTLATVGLVALLPGLVLVHVALGLPFALLVQRGALDRDVTAWLKAQRIAGQSWSHTLVGFARLASVRSAVIAVAVIEFALVWNDLVVGLLFGAGDLVPLGPLVLGESRQFVTNSAPLAAVSVVGSLVPLVLVVRARRHVVDAVFRMGLR